MSYNYTYEGDLHTATLNFDGDMSDVLYKMKLMKSLFAYIKTIRNDDELFEGFNNDFYNDFLPKTRDLARQFGFDEDEVHTYFKVHGFISMAEELYNSKVIELAPITSGE